MGWVEAWADRIGAVHRSTSHAGSGGHCPCQCKPLSRLPSSCEQVHRTVEHVRGLRAARHDHTDTPVFVREREEEATMPREKNPDIVQAQVWIMASAVSAPSGGGTSTSAPQERGVQGLRRHAEYPKEVGYRPRCWEPMAVHGVRS